MDGAISIKTSYSREYSVKILACTGVSFDAPNRAENSNSGVPGEV
jgi:hypothetical protein